MSVLKLRKKKKGREKDSSCRMKGNKNGFVARTGSYHCLLKNAEFNF